MQKAPASIGSTSARRGALAWRALVARAGLERCGLLVAATAGLVSLGVYVATPSAQVPTSDGFYSWMYARSLAFDGDIDFTNDYRLCGDGYRIGLNRGTGHPDNIFYPGPALFWVPLLLVARVVWHLPEATTCGLPWSRVALGVAPFLFAFTVYFAYRLLRRRFTDGVAALAVALLAFGGPLLKVATVLPSFSHTHDAFAVAALLLATVRAVEAPSRPSRWGWVGLALAVAVLQRLSNVGFALVPAVMAVTALRRETRRLAFATLGIFAGLALGLAVMGAIYRYLYGSPFVFTHGRYFLDLWHAHPWLMLFDREEGLLFFAPVVWLAVVGLPLALRDRPWWSFALPLVAVALGEGLLSAAALDWPPARRLSNLTPLFAWLAAYPVEAIGRWLAHGTRALTAAACLALLPVWASGVGYVWGQPRGLVPSERPLTQAELYGGSARGFWSLADETVGSVALWPAERAFQIRYGLPGQRLGDASFPRWYMRDFRTLEFGPRGISLSDPVARRLARGFEPVAGGLRPTSERPAIVFAAQWRRATHLTLLATARETVHLRVGLRRPVGLISWCDGPPTLGPGRSELTLAIPPGAFASGINELILDLSPGAGSALLLHAVTFEDREPLAPAFE